MADSVPSVSAGGTSAQKTTGGKALAPKPSKKKVATAKVPTGIPTSGARLEAWLSDPGLRSKLPDSVLPPELLAKRKANAFNAAPAAPGSSYTNAEINALIKANLAQQFGGQQQALAKRDQAIPQWFSSYRDTLQKARDAEAGASAAQVTSLQNMATAAAGDTGLPAGADPEAAARANAAAGIRSAGIGNQAALASNLGQIQSDFVGNQKLNSYGLERGALEDQAARRLALEGQIGDAKVTTRSKILGDEADAALKAALTSSQIGENTASAANTKATTTKTATDTQKTAAEIAFFKKHGYYPSTGKPTVKSPDVITSGAFAGYTKTQVANMSPDKKDQLKSDYAKKSTAKPAKPEAPKSGPGSLTPAAESKIIGQINKVYAALASPTKIVKDANGNESVRPSTAAEVLATLKAQHVDPRVLDVARSLLHNDGTGVGEMGVSAAHDLGIHINPHWRVVRSTAKKLKPAKNKSARDSR